MANSSRKWSEEEITTFILKLEMFPALWDVHSAEYRNRNVKQKALEEFCMEGAEIQRKLHILRSQYQQELKKTRIKKSGQGIDENYKSSWKHFNSLKFMHPSMTSRQSVNNMVSENDITLFFLTVDIASQLPHHMI